MPLVCGSVPSPVDVVIVAYNRFDLTESCLRHLASQSRAHRVILVENGSTDDTRARLAAEWPQVDVIPIDTNSAFSLACNAGVAAGTAEWVVLLNNDVDCRPDFVERAVAPLERDSTLGSVATLCLRPGERLIDSVGLAVDTTLAAFPRHQGRPADEAGRPEPVLAGPTGTAAAYRRQAWEELGGLDERIFAYGEDLDLTLRLRAGKWGSFAATDAVCVHLGSATHGHRSARQRRYGGFGRAYLARRYRLLSRGAPVRLAASEAMVVVGDAVLSRDLEALRGRIEGWRAARRLPVRALPPAEAVDHGITFRDSIDLRRGVYAQGQR